MFASNKSLKESVEISGELKDDKGRINDCEQFNAHHFCVITKEDEKLKTKDLRNICKIPRDEIYPTYRRWFFLIGGLLVAFFILPLFVAFLTYDTGYPGIYYRVTQGVLIAAIVGIIGYHVYTARKRQVTCRFSFIQRYRKYKYP